MTIVAWGMGIYIFRYLFGFSTTFILQTCSDGNHTVTMLMGSLQNVTLYI
jgi:hypothetical protein